MPKLVDPAEQRREIRRAARRVFGRRGVEGTGLAHVADAAGMGRTSLYHYYPDKASLVRDLVRDALGAEENLFEEAMVGEARPLERIERLLDALLATFGEWGAVGRMISELRVRDARLFRPFFRKARASLAAVVAEGQRAGEIDRALDPELASAALIGAVDGLLLQHVVDPRALDIGALRGEVVRLARKALAP